MTEASQESAMEVQYIPVAAIGVIPGVSPREKIDQRNIKSLAATGPDTWPPIIVAPIKPNGPVQYGLIGGQHRWEAAKRLKLSTIAARVQEIKTFGEARIAAIEDNIKNGLQIPQRARIELAERLKADHPELSNREIARRAGIDEKTVRRMLAAQKAGEAEADVQERYSIASETPTARKLLKLAYQLMEEHKAGGVLGIGSSAAHADAAPKRIKALVQEAHKMGKPGEAAQALKLLSDTFAEAARQLAAATKTAKQGQPAKGAGAGTAKRVPIEA